jgi:DNA-binding CsgD family transcriptional regulator
VLNERTLLANTAAATFVHASDRELIWNAVVGAVQAGRPGWSPLALAGGRVVTIRSEAVLDGVRLIGAVVHFGTDSASADGSKELHAPRDAWSRLTRAEQAVAEQVALGMTNAEAAARLYVSPHTIDFHLRQVFRKLDVRSRVELTRALVERQVSVSDQQPD